MNYNHTFATKYQQTSQVVSKTTENTDAPLYVPTYYS